MGIPVTTQYQKSIVVSRAPSEAFTFFTNYTESFGKHFPGLESLTPEATPGTYQWSFEKFDFSGLEYQVKLSTLFASTNEQHIQISTVPGSGNADLSGTITLGSQGSSGTEIKFELSISGDLPLPRLMKGIVAPKVESALKDLFDEFVTNVENTLKK